VNHHDHLTLVTLISVLTHLKLMAIFSCVVRVVAGTKCQVESLCSTTFGK